jgi:hypothetical protein
MITALTMLKPNTKLLKYSLNNMPHEIFVRICSYLEPIWLWNLSHTCHFAFVGLSFALGNKIWYDAIPAALYKEKEKYQDEAELRMVESNLNKQNYIRAIQAKKESGARATT